MTKPAQGADNEAAAAPPPRCAEGLCSGARVRDLIADGAAAGNLRDDVSAGELAGYCLRALSAAGDLDSRAAVRRLVAVTLSGLRAPG